MTFTIRRSILVVVLSLLVVAAGIVVVSQRANAASSTPVVYVATGENFPDALGAASAAAVQRGPVLLVQKDGIPTATAGELARLSPDVIYVAGGSDVVSDGVFAQLKAFAPSVVRAEGRTRYETAVEVSKSAFPVATSAGGGGDADTLDGKDSTAFALSGHNHDGTYLAAAGKAANSDKLDGLDSSAFLRANGVVMTSGAMNWQPNHNGPMTFDRAATRVRASSGTIVMSIEGPSSIGVTNFGLHKINFCIAGAVLGLVDSTEIFRLVGTASETLGIDGTDRGVGCHEIVVDASVGSGATVAVVVKGGTLDIGGIESTWTTNAYAATGVAGVTSGNATVNP